MTVEDDVRRFAATIEAGQAPVTVEEIVQGHRTVTLTQAKHRRRSRRSLAITAAAAAAAVCLVGIGAVMLIGREEPTRIEPSDTAPGTAGTVAPEEAPTTTAEAAATGTDLPMVGEAVTFEDGGRARVTSVVLDAKPRNVYTTLPTEGFRFTEIEVERCMGEVPSRVEPGNWIGVLDDGTEIAASAGYLVWFEPAPGGCTRGYIAIRTDVAATLARVELLRPEFPPQQWEWDLGRSVPVDGPLEPTRQPESVSLGEAISFSGEPGAAPPTVTVRSVADAVTPASDLIQLPPGGRLVEVVADVCAGSAPWEPWAVQVFVTVDDNYTGSGYPIELGGLAPRTSADEILGRLSSNGDFLPDLDPRECVVGEIQIVLPEGSIPAYVVVTEDFGEEVGRVSLS